MPTPENIVAAQTALNHVELALQSIQAQSADPQTSALAHQALQQLSSARYNLS